MHRDDDKVDNPVPDSPLRRQLLGGLLSAAVPALPLILPSSARAADAPIQVGGLPVTCNLTLPIACVAKAANAAPGVGRAALNTANTAAGRRSRNR
jgi:NitT/TauT family transport system substrate-binding protein